FDLPEAETELVAGHHTEYSGIKFAMFYLAEYLHMVTVSAVGVTLFLGGWRGPMFHAVSWLWPVLWFLVKLVMVIYVLIWIQATTPGQGVTLRSMARTVAKVVGGFSVTFRQVFRRDVTKSYPIEVPVLPARSHVGRHRLNRYDNGLEKCIGCELCAWACPAD